MQLTIANYNCTLLPKTIRVYNMVFYISMTIIYVVQKKENMYIFIYIHK